MAKGRKTGGRKKGTPNKTTALVKDAMTAVYADLQAHEGEGNPEWPSEHPHFFAWALDNPTEFYKLTAKLLPLQVDVEAGKRLATALTWRPPT